MLRSFYNDQELSREDVLCCVPEGWRELTSKLIDKLFTLGWNGRIAQVKEKFGGLRFYIGGGTTEIHDAIQLAENESYETCQQCSALGSERYDGWSFTLCDSCWERVSKRHEKNN